MMSSGAAACTHTGTHTHTHTAHTLAMSANKAFSVGPMLRHSRGWRTQLPTIWMSSCELMPGSQTRRTAGQRRPGQRQRDESGRGPGMHGSHGASTRRPMGAWTLASAEARRHRADVTILERIASHPSAPQRQPASHEPNFSQPKPSRARHFASLVLCIFARRVCVDRRGSKEWHHFWVWDALSGVAAAR